MSFWDTFEKDMKKHIQEGLSIVKEGGAVVTEKLEKLTDEGKKKYRVFNLNMKVQEEFTKLGGQIYDLTAKKSKNPLGNRNVAATIKRINKLETQITKLEDKGPKKPVKKAARKAKRKVKPASRAKRAS